MPLPKAETYTLEDIYNLPDGERAELIDGQIYYMAPTPSRTHQLISGDLFLVTYLQQYTITSKNIRGSVKFILLRSLYSLIRMILTTWNRTFLLSAIPTS